MARAAAKPKTPSKPAPAAEVEDEPEIVMSTSTEVVNWEDQMALDAKVAKGLEAKVGGTQFFKTEGGILALGDKNIPGNTIIVSILHHVLENVFYENQYVRGKNEPPLCYAFGEDEDTIKPHDDVFARDQEQHEQCAGCPMNAYGTADVGRGKACSNRRRLMVLPVGQYDPKSEKVTLVKGAKGLADQEPVFLTIPPTALKGWASYVRSMADDFGRPPYGVATKITIAPHKENQVEYTFTLVDKLANDMMPYIFSQHKKAKELIEAPHNLDKREGETGKRPEIRRGKAGAPPPSANAKAGRAGAAAKSGRY